MKKITFLFTFLIASIGFSQEVIQSFEAAGAVGGEFGQMAVPTVLTGTGSNTTQVLEIIGNTGGDVWQGVNINLTKNVQLTTSKTMSIDIKSATPITILVKVNGGASAPNAAAEVTHNGDGTWQTLTFSFNDAITRDGHVGTANGVYSNFVIHAYWVPGATSFGTGKPSRTFYVDNVYGTAAPLLAPTVAAPTPPARLAADVVSIYSDQYTAISPINYDAGWCEGTGAVTATTAGGNAVFKYNGKPCQGINFASALQNVTGFTRIHVDLFIASGTDLVGKVFNMKIVPSSGAESAFNIDFGALAVPPVPGTWFSYDAPISFSGPTLDIKEFGVTSNLNNVVWYDNLYLYKGTPLSTKDFAIAGLKVYPNPAQDNWTISTKNIKMSSIQVYDVLGKNVLTVSPNAIEAKINASSLKAGLYFAKINTANGVSSIKLVKE